jgi:hypothetical protein
MLKTACTTTFADINLDIVALAGFDPFRCLLRYCSELHVHDIVSTLELVPLWLISVQAHCWYSRTVFSFVFLAHAPCNA